MASVERSLTERAKDALFRAPARTRRNKIGFALGFVLLFCWIALSVFTDVAGWSHPNVLLAPFLILVNAAEIIPTNRRTLAAKMRFSAAILCVFYLIWLTAWVVSGQPTG